MLKISGLNASYGGIKALRGVDIEVKPGELVAVLGPNGAGKSTLLKAISAAIKSVTGEIIFCGSPTPKAPYQVVKAGICHVPEGRQIFANLTVHENLMVGAFLRNDKAGIKEDLDQVYKFFPILKQRERQYGGYLSGGEQQMLAISRGLMARPKLMILDEPSLGLAPIIVDQIFNILKEVNEMGTSMLIVEQNVYKALSIADRGYVLSTGVVEQSGKSCDLASDEKLLKTYLGS